MPLLCLLLLLTPVASHAQSGQEVLQTDLRQVQQNQAELQQQLKQYRNSISILEANAPPGIEPRENPAVAGLYQALEELLEQLKQEQAKEAQLLEMQVALAQMGADSPQQRLLNRPSIAQQNATEVTQLQDLLRTFFRESDSLTQANNALAAAANDIDSTFTPDQVLLNGSEAAAALQQIDQRLNNSSIPASSRNIDIVYHVEVRRGGTLISSSSHTLRALGKEQFIGRVKLSGGQLNITVRNRAWTATLPAGEEQVFLVTLNSPSSPFAELHVMAMPQLKEHITQPLPGWLQKIGNFPSA